MKSLNFLFIRFIKSIKIGKSKFTSDDLLPQKREIISLSLDIMLDKSLYATRQLAKRQDTWMRGWEKYIELKDGDPKILINNVKNLVSSL